jgi:hypothetical protein
VQKETDDRRRKRSHAEEQEESRNGKMPEVRNKNVQDRRDEIVSFRFLFREIKLPRRVILPLGSFFFTSPP